MDSALERHYNNKTNPRRPPTGIDNARTLGIYRLFSKHLDYQKRTENTTAWIQLPYCATSIHYIIIIYQNQHKMLRTHTLYMGLVQGSYASSSSSSITTSTDLLWQLSPRQPPHATTHFKPFLWQEHWFVAHCLLVLTLHLQQINLSTFAGAASKSVIIGRIMFLSIVHPHSSASRHLLSSSFH